MGSRTDSVASKLLDAVSVGAGATEFSQEIDVREVERLVIAVTSIGTNLTVTAQASLDNGNTWVDRATGVTAVGYSDVIEMPGGTHLRLKAVSTDAGAQSVTAWVVVQL